MGDADRLPTCLKMRCIIHPRMRPHLARRVGAAEHDIGGTAPAGIIKVERPLDRDRAEALDLHANLVDRSPPRSPALADRSVPRAARDQIRRATPYLFDRIVVAEDIDVDTRANGAGIGRIGGEREFHLLAWIKCR